MQKLQAMHFAYPFSDAATPYQHAFALVGEHDLAQQHTSSVMEKIGRMDSFDIFMNGKFGPFGTLPERLLTYGHLMSRCNASQVETHILWSRWSHHVTEGDNRIIVRASKS
jgi:hypothetical protein